MDKSENAQAKSDFNWIINEQKKQLATNEEFGILPDGTIFVKEKSLPDFSPQQIHIKPKEMGYIPQPMIEVRLSNGEEAFIWNRNPKTLGKYKQ